MTAVRQLLVLLTAALAAAPASVAAGQLSRADGSEIIYHLDQRGKGRQGLLLALQGSGCEPVVERAWLKSDPPVLAPGRAVVAIEKYGVRAGQSSANAIEGCSPEYWRKNTLQQRVLDALQVLAQLRSEKWWNRELIIYGGSEGGAIAAMLAPLVPETKAAIIVSSGIGVPVAELIRSAVPPPVAAQIPIMLAEAKAAPTGDKIFGGQSYHWWAEAAEVTPAKALLQSDAAVLLVHGTDDRNAPVATARATRDMFAEAGKRNLTYYEYQGYDHAMKDVAGIDHTTSVLHDISRWLKRR